MPTYKITQGKFKGLRLNGVSHSYAKAVTLKSVSLVSGYGCPDGCVSDTIPGMCPFCGRTLIRASSEATDKVSVIKRTI